MTSNWNSQWDLKIRDNRLSLRKKEVALKQYKVTMKDIKRYEIINDWLAKKTDGNQTSLLLKVNYRQPFLAKLIANKYRSKYPTISKILDVHLEETLTFYGYPEKHRRKVRTTNLIEWLNKMIKKRSRVIGIFPNAESCKMYVSSLLMEIDEDWQTVRRYMGMDYLEEINASNVDEDFMKEISKVKLEAEINEELVTQ